MNKIRGLLYLTLFFLVGFSISLRGQIFISNLSQNVEQNRVREVNVGETNQANQRSANPNNSILSCIPDPKPTIHATASPTPFTAISCTTMTFNWINGDGSNRIVKMNTVNVFTDPLDTTSYVANPVYGGGQQVVYNGTGSSAPVSGLTTGVTYFFKVYEYNVTTTNCTESYYTTGTPLTANQATLSTSNFFRSSAAGNWNDPTKWESSTDNVNWYPACTFPTNTAAAVTIRHTNITINTAATAPNITIISGGTLRFDGVSARSLTVTNYVTINSGGTFITQSSGVATNTMTIGGDLTNDGVFDMTSGGSTNVTFNKNGNQNISGTGATTHFNFVTVNLGASYLNILDISTSNFQAPANFLHDVSASVPLLKNGTIRFSGTFNFTGTLLQTGANYTIVSTAGVWLNNPNVTISGQNDSYIINGYFRITNGIFNAGNSTGNSLKYKTGSVFIIEGGIVNSAGRLQGNATADVLNYTQTAGTINLVCVGVLSASLASLDIQSATSSFTMSGGTIVYRNQNSFFYDVNIPTAITTNITGGVFQFADASTTSFSAAGYLIFSASPLPSINIFSINVAGIYPVVKLAKDLTVKGSVTIGIGAKLDVSNTGTTGNCFAITMSGNTSTPGDWINNGIFDQRERKVTFNGTTNQNIGGTSSTTFDSLIVNKGSSSKLILNINTNVGVNSFSGTTGVLTLTLGFLDLNGYKLTAFNSTPSGISPGSSTSYIISETAVGTPTLATNPSLIQWNMGVNTSVHVFPFGTSGFYLPVAFQKNATSANISISTRATSTSDNMPWTGPTNVAAVSTMFDQTIGADGSVEAVIDRWWEVYSSTPGVTVSILKFTYRGAENTLNGTYNHAALAAQNWSGSKWLPPVCSACGVGVTLPPGSSVIVTGTTLDSGAVWVLSSQIAPLPITLISFDGKCEKEGTILKWITESEINNDYFTVEKSNDAKEFMPISAAIRGAGNSSSTHYYQFIDKEVSATNYYRIKQTDFDGKFSYSDYISVKCKDDLNIVAIYPNPASDKLYISLLGNKLEENLTLDILDLKGSLIRQYILPELKNDSEPIDISGLAKGFYLLKAHNNLLLYTTKLIKD